MTGIDYPVVTVGGKDYTVRFSLRAEYLLSANKISLQDLLPEGSPGRLNQRMVLWSHAVGDNFPDPLKSPSAYEWSQRITRSEWSAIDAALDEALKKVEAEWKPATPPMLAAVG